MKRVSLHLTLCNGCSYCSDKDPVNWAMDPATGKAFLKNGHLVNNQYEMVVPAFETEEFEKVALVCPARAIRITGN